MMNTQQLTQVSEDLDGKSPDYVIDWAVETLGNRLAVGSSLGAEAMVIMDMVTRIKPDVPFIFLDTDFHFADTLGLLDEAKKRYNINLIVARPELTPAEQAAKHGEQLFFRDPGQCCEIRKLAPMRKALVPFDAWITGMRRDQNTFRTNLGPVVWDEKFNLIKINPLINWSWGDVWQYIKANDVPYNRLHDIGYPSIGCAPCTQPVKPGEDLRAGRWSGFDKTECGLHK